MPVHPLKGQRLNLIRMRRDHFARCETVIAETPGGGRIVLPVEWTDRGPPWVTPTIDGTEVRLGAQGLLALSYAVDAIVRQEVGPSAPLSSGSPEAKCARKDGDVSSRDPGGRVGRADAGHATRSARRVGQRVAQDASSRRGHR